jgi:hypothetical protein
MTVSITGPQYFAPATAVIQPIEGILQSGTPASFNLLSISEDPPDLLFDNISGIWRGSAFGQRNTLNVSFLPNLDVFSGANITLSGLFSSKRQTERAPSVRQLESLVTDLVVESWLPATGRLVLRVSSARDGPVFKAQQLAAFGLEIDMPLNSSLSLTISPVLTIEASGLGPRRECCCTLQSRKIWTQVLISKPTNLNFFSSAKIAQTCCFPGECNTISISFSISKAVASPSDNLYVFISGFSGMNMDQLCSPLCSKSPSNVLIQDTVTGQ